MGATCCGKGAEYGIARRAVGSAVWESCFADEVLEYLGAEGESRCISDYFGLLNLLTGVEYHPRLTYYFLPAKDTPSPDRR